MNRNVFIVAAVVSVVGCGCSATSDGSGEAQPADEPTAFDSLVESVERAESVQQTIDERAAAQRRRIEQAER